MTSNPISDRDGPRDECGVFGVLAPESEVARLAYFGLFALQHRGQESAGIAACEDGHIMTVRDLGLVSQVFDIKFPFSIRVHSSMVSFFTNSK